MTDTKIEDREVIYFSDYLDCFSPTSRIMKGFVLSSYINELEERYYFVTIEEKLEPFIVYGDMIVSEEEYTKYKEIHSKKEILRRLQDEIKELEKGLI
jgi:hypothetical protein